MKGKATIQLYDKKGHLIYRRIEENTVTNAVENIFNQNYAINGLKNNGGNVVATYTPIWKDFAGLMLFKDEIDDGVIIPNKNAISGFTGNATDADNYDASNIYEGVYVASESEIQNEYCKFVFKFPIGKVPGTISSIALTSIAGGNTGLSGGDKSLFLSYSNQNLQNGDKCGVGLDVPSSNFVPYVDTSIDGMPIGITTDGMLITVKNSSNKCYIKKYSMQYKLNFLQTFSQISSYNEYVSQYGGTLDNAPMFKLEKTYEINHTLNIDTLCIKDSYIYETTIESMSGNLRVHCTRYELKSDGTTTFVNGYVDYSNVSYSSVQTYRYCNDGLWFTDGSYLYIAKVTYENVTEDIIQMHITAYDKIELVANNLTPIPFKDTVALLNVSNITNNQTRDIYFLTNSNILQKNTLKFAGTCDKIVNFCFNFGEPIFGIITTTNGVATINTNIFAPYLATINNITTITKYSTVEMKVTYELYTEDYVEE